MYIVSIAFKMFDKFDLPDLLKAFTTDKDASGAIPFA